MPMVLIYIIEDSIYLTGGGRGGGGRGGCGGPDIGPYGSVVRSRYSEGRNPGLSCRERSATSSAAAPPAPAPASGTGVTAAEMLRF